MQKIMFNEPYGLQQAVIDGRKPITRREPYFGEISKPNSGFYVEGKDKGRLALCDGEMVVKNSRYRVGEVVAVAQSYKDVHDYYVSIDSEVGIFETLQFVGTSGWTNKMFVKADLMPHLIRITDIKVERLQDISNEDCLKEGVYKDEDGGRIIGNPFGIPFYYTFFGAKNKEGKQLHWTTPREAFAALIDKVSGKGTWEKNPWVFSYSFELVK